MVTIEDFLKDFHLFHFPLTKLTQKTVKFISSEAYEKGFQELKKRLIIAPILTLSESTQGFVVYCDASKVGFGMCVYAE